MARFGVSTFAANLTKLSPRFFLAVEDISESRMLVIKRDLI